MEKDDLYGIISIVLSLIAIILSYNKSYLPATIIIGVAAVTFYYLSKYTKQIEKNEDEIKKIKYNIEANEKLLNTIKDIVILNKVKNKMNKKGIKDTDILDLIKIALLVILGYIIIKILISIIS
ncbi:hypothetical protein COU56_03880 [Candidatus Pacearchaeota archaeon CG10_big_fil_rev_8_21_14_0_10_31_9]|nr:MAG: hypothetical protein AUJ62_01470 [Candidatus Pacearchaeota archaeon CG1_02_32_21]PIN93045.1 MAG: hypothetical protein COU56_03880 [Candidatus Pacearchaeota archaeon CG10_big_fil_rev_8_21_14_0_10_31_9]PIZ82523.1 MAG: hypothetical protein COX97_04350 [Candidatus Pacearchaeota archaeon CG_4_10_14_0_2_um_filter_05_32_18]